MDKSEIQSQFEQLLPLLSNKSELHVTDFIKASQGKLDTSQSTKSLLGRQLRFAGYSRKRIEGRLVWIRPETTRPYTAECPKCSKWMEQCVEQKSKIDWQAEEIAKCKVKIGRLEQELAELQPDEEEKHSKIQPEVDIFTRRKDYVSKMDQEKEDILAIQHNNRVNSA